MTSWAPGDRVAALVEGGGYGEYVVCNADVMLRVPDEMPYSDAAALPEALYTAYLNLFMEAALQPGERALVHAGASGVGTAAIQICRALGCPVYATASGSKLERLRELGAELAIDRREEDFVERVRAASEGRGVDAILCCVGADYFARNLQALARGGRLVIIGLLGGAKSEIPIQRLLINCQRVIGSVLRSRSVAEKAEITRQLAERVWPHVIAGTVRPVIDRVLPIADANEAHAAMRRVRERDAHGGWRNKVRRCQAHALRRVCNRGKGHLR